MRYKITFKEFVASPMYNQMGTIAAKSFVFYFSIFCLYFGLFSDYKVGLWWIPIWFVGSIVVSLIFAFLCNTIKVLFLLKFANQDKEVNKKIPYALNLIDVVFLVALFLLLRWFLAANF
jgi:hypothetical protein